MVSYIVGLSRRRVAGARVNMHQRKHKEVINRGTRGGYLRPVQKDVTELRRIRGCTHKCATASVRVARRVPRGDIPRSLVSERRRDKIVLIHEDGNAPRTNGILITSCREAYIKICTYI